MSISTFDEYPRGLKDDDPILIDNWKILHVIGAGGMGKVFSGVSKDHTYVAIKIINTEEIDDNYLKRFKKEISAMKLLNSPYIARMVSSKIDHNPPYLAIELIHGKTLAKQIENKKVYTEALWFNIARQIFLGLKEIHARGLTHRDIKPANIMQLEDKDQIKIIDFGVVKNEDSRNNTRTVVVGTLPYMSPEQLSHITPTPKSDIFSAGITLVQLATKNHPFYFAKDSAPIAHAILNKEPNLDGLTDKQIKLCEKLLIKDPDLRLSATEALKMIDDLTGRAIIRSSNLVAIKRPAIKAKAVKVVAKKKVSIDPVLLGVIDEFQVSPVVNLSPMKIIAPDFKKFQVLKKQFQTQIADLSSVLELLLQDLGTKTFHLDFFSKSLQHNIYSQGFIEKDNKIFGEVISNNFLDIKLDAEQTSYLLKEGWAEPKEDSPNFLLRDTNTTEFRRRLSKLIAETFFSVYGADLNSEFYISPRTPEFISKVQSQLGIKISVDGSFKLKGSKRATDQYSKWQLIGFFGKDGHEEDLVLETLVARHIEKDLVYKRENKEWKNIGVINNPVKNGINKVTGNGFLFDKKIISKFDTLEEKREVADFKDVQHLLDYAPILSEKYLEKEKVWPLTNDLIQLGSDTASDFEDYLGLFTLSSNNLRKNIVLGLFARHPQTQEFYGRSGGRWRLLFESPLSYGYEIFFVKKSFIDFFDKRAQKPENPILRTELEAFIHTV